MISYKCKFCGEALTLLPAADSATLVACSCKQAQESFLKEHRAQVEARRMHNRSLSSRDSIKKRVRSK